MNKMRNTRLIADRNISQAVISECIHSSDADGLLISTLRIRRNENTGVLCPQATGSPDVTSDVPESLPLRRKIITASRNPEKYGIIFKKLLGFDKQNRRFGRIIAFHQHIDQQISFKSTFRESAMNGTIFEWHLGWGRLLEKVSSATGTLDPPELCLC